MQIVQMDNVGFDASQPLHHSLRRMIVGRLQVIVGILPLRTVLKGRSIADGSGAVLCKGSFPGPYLTQVNETLPTRSRFLLHCRM